MARYVPGRGDAVWLECDPQAGQEQAGRRPALVVSPAPYNSKVGLVVVCPITSQVKGYPFEVPIPPSSKVTGVVLADQIESIDWQARKARLILQLPDHVTEQVLLKLQTLLG
jgi:mRNA interferase MazF